MKYQPFNDLPGRQFELLKADIAARGVVVPIAVDEYDNVIDGHQRRRACAELHRDCPKIIHEGLDDDEKMALAIALNAFRRHLTSDERNVAIQRLHLLGWSNRKIAEAVGVSEGTVRYHQRGGAQSYAPAPPEGVDPGTGEIAPTEPTVEQGSSSAVGSEEGAGDDGREAEEVADDVPASPAPTHVVGKDGKKYPVTNRASTSEAAVARRREDIKRLAGEGLTSHQIAKQLGISRVTVLDHAKAIELTIHADAIVARVQRAVADEVMERTVQSIHAATSGLADLVDFAQLDGDFLEEWVSSLNESLRSLTTLRNRIKKELTRG